MIVNVVGCLVVCVFAYIGMKKKPNWFENKVILTERQFRRMARELAEKNAAEAAAKQAEEAAKEEAAKEGEEKQAEKEGQIAPPAQKGSSQTPPAPPAESAGGADKGETR